MILRIGICIPTYNNPLTIQSTVKDCLLHSSFQIVVIDDGSTFPVTTLITDPFLKMALTSGRLQIIRLEKNLGKGGALQIGFKIFLNRGFTHLLSMDGDGQHLVSEIKILVDTTLLNPWDLILGNRKLTALTVPGISKFGRKFSNFWVGFQTDIKVADSQSGFRVYPIFHIQNLRFWTKGFDFEIEVLIRLLWRGVNVKEVEIEVFYPPSESRVSHFHKFWDNLRITILHTVFVVLSLLKSRRSPLESSVSIGIGVMIGCTPFYGFHTLLVAAVSFLFKRNAAFMFLGSQISVPPMIPFIILASLNFGRVLLPHHLETFLGKSTELFLGSLALGLVLGMIAGLITYLLLSRFEGAPSKGKAWNGESRGGAFGNTFLKILIKKYGPKPAQVLLYLIVPYFYLFAPKARRSADEYWRTLAPSKNFLKRQFCIVNQFYSFAQVLLDRVFQSFTKIAQFKVRPNGFIHIVKGLESKTGLILVTGHLGGWDISSSLLRSEGLSGDFHTVQYESAGLTLNKVKDGADSQNLIPLSVNLESQPVLKIKQWLSEGKPVGVMGDRPLGNQYELVSFLGKLAPIDCTPYRIAAACQARLLFTFGFKEPENVYAFYATEPKQYLYNREINRQLQCYLWAGEFASILESFVRKYPTQWANFFPFWSTPPSLGKGDDPDTRVKNYLKEELEKQDSAGPVSESASRPTV